MTTAFVLDYRKVYKENMPFLFLKFQNQKLKLLNFQFGDDIKIALAICDYFLL